MPQTNRCPNCCGDRPSRSDTDILCEECFNSCPWGQDGAKALEDDFRSAMESIERMHSAFHGSTT